MEFLSAYNFSLSYRRDKYNANADFLSRLPFPPTKEDNSGYCVLSGPDDLGVYFIRACGFKPIYFRILAISLGGQPPLSPSIQEPGSSRLIPQPDPPIMGWLLLTHDDFNIHLAPLPTPHMVGSIDRPHLISGGDQCSPYVIRAHDKDTRPPYTRRTRSKPAIFAGNIPSRLDYHMAASSEFAASDALAPPSLRALPPPRSTRLGFTTPDHLAS